MLMNDRFSKLHPLFHAAFFVLVFVFVLSVNNPFYSAIALLSSLLYGIRIRGRQIVSSVKFTAIMLIVVSLFNMLFAHYGEDVLFTIGDTKFTLEALFYGFNQGMVLSAVMLWFGAFSRVMDSERVVYLLRFAPKIALIFSMVLGFIPRFTKKLEDIRDAQLGLNSGEPPKKRLTQALNNFSALVSYSLESSIITADSMSARGYNPKAVKPARFKIYTNDIVLICLVILLAICIIVNKAMGNIIFVFDPEIYVESFSALAYISFCVMCFLPLIIDSWEDLLWKLSNAKR